MNSDETSRRLFLIQSLTGLSSAWLALRLPEIVAAQEHAHNQAHKMAHKMAAAAVPAKFEFFTPEQAKEVEAIAAQIIPTDDTPGAREAHAIFFIDRALTTFDKDKQAAYTKGLKDLQARQKKLFPKAASFSDLSPEQQIALLKKIEKTEFFNLVRGHTVVGCFSDPEYGGNFNGTGWKLIGFEDRFNYKPPFGYYDREFTEGR